MLIVLQTSQLKSEIIWKSNEGFAIAHPSLSGAKRIKFKTKRRTNKLKKKKMKITLKASNTITASEDQKTLHMTLLSVVGENFLKNKNN